MLAVALAAFVGTHFLLSHPLRSPLMKALGDRGFQIIYSLVAIATFVWVVIAFRATPAGPPLWAANDGLWAIASLLMLAGSILFAGSFAGNPALPAPQEVAKAASAQPARGVFAITRHPMMWGFSLWALVHLLVSPQPKVVWLTAAIAFLAIFGSVGQDAKKAALMGESWRDWERRTAFIPFAAQLSGRSSWATTLPGRTVTLAGIALWLIASWLHPVLGGPVTGIWRWTGG